MELTVIDPKQFGIEENQALDMTSGLTTILTEREPLKDAFLDIINLDVTESNITLFRELRLKIRDNRTKGIEPYRKSKGEVFLRAKQFIDATCNNESEQNERMESKLLEKEKHFENLEKERLAKLKAERWAKLQVFTESEPFGLELMDETTFDNLLAGAKLQHDAKIEAEKKAEADRLEKERVNQLYFARLREVEKFRDFSANIVDIDMAAFGTMSEEEYSEILSKLSEAKAEREKEIEAQRLENERLKKEAEEKEKALEAERKKAEAEKKAIEDKAKKEAAELEAKRQSELQIERDKQAKLEAELKAKKDAEIKAEQERLTKEEQAKKDADKLAKAPIKKQLSVWLETFKHDQEPINETAKEIVAKFESFKKWASSEIEKL